MPNDARPSLLETGQMVAFIKRYLGGAGTWNSLVTAATGWVGGLDWQKIGPLIVLRGSFTNTGGAAGATLVTLPAGARPGATMLFDTFALFANGDLQPQVTSYFAVSGFVFVQEN